jgi:hypothetical protein
MMWQATLSKSFDSSKLALMNRHLVRITSTGFAFATGLAVDYLAVYKFIYNHTGYKS